MPSTCSARAIQVAWLASRYCGATRLRLNRTRTRLAGNMQCPFRLNPAEPRRPDLVGWVARAESEEGPPLFEDGGPSSLTLGRPTTADGSLPFQQRDRAQAVK